MKREIYPRHKANCPNGRAKHPRKKFDGCRVNARYTITDPQTGKLLEAFTGALPPHITTKAGDTYVNQRFALVIDEPAEPPIPTFGRDRFFAPFGFEQRLQWATMNQYDLNLFRRVRDTCCHSKSAPEAEIL